MLDFSVTVSDSSPPVVNGDELRITQILTNIMSNAVKLKKGFINFSCDYQNGTAIFRVQDSGIGIARTR